MTIYRIFILVLGVYACSTAVIMVKMSAIHPVLLSALRLLVGAAFLSPVWLASRLKQGAAAGGTGVRRTILPAVMLGLHFITWIAGARLTLAANASLIVNLVPVAMPFLLYFLSRELINRGEVLGTILAMLGVVFLVAADFRISLRTFGGDMICLLSMLFFAAYLALGRRGREVDRIWLFVVPLYAVAGIFCLAVSPIFMNPFSQKFTAREILLVLGLGVIPTVIGHSSLLYCMKHLRAQVVAIATLGQFVFAGIMAYFFLGEAPDLLFYLSSALLVAGAVVAIRSSKPDAA